MSRLAKFVNSLDSSPKWGKCPLVHSTVLSFMQSILDNKSLSCVQCNVFNEKLLYLFYGKPSYKNQNIENQAWFPVCFILKNEIVQSNEIKNVFPFDSGAFKARIYEGFIESHKKLDDYTLPKNIQAIDKFLNYFFEEFNDYYYGKPTIKEPPALSLELTDCYNLYGARGIQNFDERAKSIEISVNKDIKLSSQNIELLICPESLRQNIDVYFQDEPNFNVEYYQTYNLGSAEKYYYIIEDIANKYINKVIFNDK